MADETLRTGLETWCRSYVTAFSAYDADAIAAHWSFPALIVQGERTFTFDTTKRFGKNTAALLGFYRAQDVAAAERTLVQAMAMGPDSAAITVADRMVDPRGKTIVAWQAAYVLVRAAGRWRAVYADAAGETAAWAANGTPLGG